MARVQFVVTERGTYLAQVVDAELFPRHGFALLDEDQTWEGGLGAAASWRVVTPEEVPPAKFANLRTVVEALYE
jgi:hypothetical protein